MGVDAGDGPLPDVPDVGDASADVPLDGPVPDVPPGADQGCDPPADGGPDAAPPTVPLDPTTPPPAAQGCLMNEFFIEAALGSPALGFEAFEFLPQLINAPPEWFCEEGGCQPQAQVMPLFAGLDQVPGGQAAMERFARVRFLDAGRGQVLDVREDRLGDLIHAIREAMLQVPGQRRQVLVGRECGVRVLTVEPTATAAMRGWHVSRVGPVAGAAPARPVLVSLIDTGLRDADRAILGGDVEDVRLPIDGADDTPHPHGAAMGLLVSSVAPDADLLHLRALGGDGVGRVGDVARSIGRALEVAEGRAHVINLSVGWPPELGRPRLAPGEGGPFIEDPVGESVRFMLDVARRRSTVEAPTVVIAAAGNRPGHPVANELIYNAWFDVLPEPYPTNCPGDPVPAGPPLFFPAFWSRLPTCDPDAQYLAVAVGGHDDADQPLRVGIEASDPPIVAPAELVYVDHPRLPPSVAPPICDPAGLPAEDVLVSPSAHSGTSVAAALTSGLVARILGTGAAVPDPRRLRSLLYVSGRPLGRLSHARAEVHAISACRAVAALDCPDLSRCALDGPADGSFEAPDCDAEFVACAPLAACPDPVIEAAQWPPEYRPGPPVACLCNDAPDGADVACPDPDRTRELCPYEAGVDGHSLGFVGPQPSAPPCPECALWLYEKQGARGDVLLDLNGFTNPATEFVDAYAVVKPAGGATRFVSLAPYTSIPDWTPGKEVVVRAIKMDAALNAACDAAGCTASAVIYGRDKPGGVIGKQTSPLRVLKGAL